MSELQQGLIQQGGGLTVRYGFARDEIVQPATPIEGGALFFNHDNEPAAIAGDITACMVSPSAASPPLVQGCRHFERDEILTAAGTPFSVFTPYKTHGSKK